MSLPKPKRYLRIADVRRRYACSDMWVARAMRDRGFPRPVSLSARDRFWIESECDAWDEAMIAQGPMPTPVPPRKAV